MSIRNSALFEPVKPNQWYETHRYIFRIKKVYSTVGACLSIHKTIPEASSQLCRRVLYRSYNFLESDS
jgi:hypothetical protein